MPENWRDHFRRYKNRWLIGLSIGLSILLHIGLVIFMYLLPFISPSLWQKPDSIEFDLAQMDPEQLKSLVPGSEAQEEEPKRLDFRRVEANRQRPEKAEAYGFQDHEAGRGTHRGDREIEESQRQVGPRGPGQGSGRPGREERDSAANAGQPREGQGARSGALPPIPEIGEGVGDLAQGSARDRENMENESPSVDQLISRTGMTAGGAGGGGESGIDPYNPNVGDAGQAVSISTREYRYMSYFAHMKEKIEMAWVYPVASQQRGEQGSVTLAFTVLRNGQVTEVKVLKTSGFKQLDQYAIKAVREAYFNPMPANWSEEQLTITANFIYRLIGYRTIR